MNSIRVNNVLYKYVFYWRDSKKKKMYDVNNKIIKFPKHCDILWNDKDIFIKLLLELQNILYVENKYVPLDKKNFKKCLICGKNNIIIGHYMVNNIMWNTGIKHYIKKHNIKPPIEFIDYVYRFLNSKKTSSRSFKIDGVKIIKSDIKYLKLTRNQILIIDALMEHGGEQIYKDQNNKNIYRYSEHAGLLDFNNTGLEKIIISANTTRVDEDDDSIYMPKLMKETIDYEYMFHTHPPTPNPGGRISDGVLYEFPSSGDMLVFIHYYNIGKTQGSIVMTPEGMYVIRKKIIDDKKIIINEDSFYNDYETVIWNMHKKSIQMYKDIFTLDNFYNKIIKNTTFIDNINKVTNKYMLHIDYYPRVKDEKNKWIVDMIYLPVYVVELDK